MKMQRYQLILVKPNYSVHLVLNSLLLHLQFLHSFHSVLVDIVDCFIKLQPCREISSFYWTCSDA